MSTNSGAVQMFCGWVGAFLLIEGEIIYQTVNKLHSCLIACVGATIGRPPTYRSNAFSGTVFCKANGHGRAMLAPTSVFRQSAIFWLYPVVYALA